MKRITSIFCNFKLAVPALLMLSVGCAPIGYWSNSSVEIIKTESSKIVKIEGFLFSGGFVSEKIDGINCEFLGQALQIKNFHPLMMKIYGFTNYDLWIEKFDKMSKLKGFNIKLYGKVRKIDAIKPDVESIWVDNTEDLPRYEIYSVSHIKIGEMSECEPLNK